MPASGDLGLGLGAWSLGPSTMRLCITDVGMVGSTNTRASELKAQLHPTMVLKV